MRRHFAEVLARESARLADVRDSATLADWRAQVVEEILTPCSSYALALRQASDAPERDDFVDAWRGLITGAVARVMCVGRARGADGSASCVTGGIDPQETAVLILAAIHGGNTLSLVAQDPSPLNTALDIAVAPLLRHLPSPTAALSPGGEIRSAESVT